MRTRRNSQFSRLIQTPCILALAVTALAISALACGGSSGLGDFVPGPLVCAPLGNQSYEYQVQSSFEMLEATGTPPPSTAAFNPAFTLVETITGRVSGGTKLSVQIDNFDGSTHTTSQVIELENNVAYRNSGKGWNQEDTSKLAIIRYLPTNVCSSLAPDVDSSKLGTAQGISVNGIASQQFTFSDLPTQFFARDPDFGGASDAATYISTLDGTIALANKGGYPTQFDITGVGAYPNGQTFKIRITFQVSNFGQSQDIKPPI